jgi:hypothetical protein
LLCREIECATAEEARLLGAICNIAEGHSEPIDAARIFRSGVTTEEAAELGISFSAKLSKQAELLAGLSDHTWHRLTQGLLGVDVAVAVASSTTDPLHQDALAMEAIRRGWDGATVSEMGKLAETARRRERQEEAQLNLLPAPPEESDLGARLAVRLAIKSRLQSEKRALGCVRGKYGKYIAQSGSRLDKDGARAAQARVSVLLERFDQLAATNGPVQDLVELLVSAAADGEEPRKLVERHFGLLQDCLNG